MRTYRRKGPPGTTRQLIDIIRATGLGDASLLDVGGGIGVLHHELLGDVASSAVHVDAASAYLEVARVEASRRGHEELVRFRHADLVDVAGDLPVADIVALDRVVCCYPDYRGLLEAAASRARRFLAFSYPRDRWYLRPVLAGLNLLRQVRRSPFRSYIHPIHEMGNVLKGADLQRVALIRLMAWQVAMFAR